ncbi:acetyl-CoA synthetase [Desulfotomaculum arcticum]|uniref:acetate--CoA ligase n=1 Tax=Desulfotruncus arcticus DSM 17038 TaxID=1121424 RepID=A0A1I2ZIR2_9FIRM|nr:AMP-binding protein [Desulfotruncus arcticus]SFH37634.1 acetyl-CoA synthetase [Desulfotomaculum arcticum] [Desulfotruncus arcticus DSM 17038]
MSKLVISALPGVHNLMNYSELVLNFNFQEAFEEFYGATEEANISYYILERNISRGMGDKVALYFEGDDRQESFTFSQLQEKVNKFANVLDKRGLGKGDRIALFLPRTPELYISFLGAVKKGLVVVPIFEAFMEDAVKDRLLDSAAAALVTNADLLVRVPKKELPQLRTILLTEGGRSQETLDWHAEVAKASPDAEYCPMGREDPLFILYAAGADGRPKGLVHVHGCAAGLWATATWVHDLKADDVYWCTADPGWITGIAYGFLAPWLHGVTVLVKGGRFDAPRWCAALQNYRVSVWYSAPTAFRMIIAAGQDTYGKYDLSNLRHILSVGEPLTEDVMRWSQTAFGIPIYDTWWMSETGMNMICNFRCLDIKLGSIGKPVPGIKAAVVDDAGNELPPYRIGNLAIKAGWPAMARDVWENHQKYLEYFKLKPWFISGDAAYMDEDGYFYFQGRVDGIINTAGERVGPWEVEKKLKEHPAVKDAGVAGKPDKIRGEIIKAYIVLTQGYFWSEKLAQELRNYVKTGLAAHAAPREFLVKESIPKTPDGQVDRKTLRGWALELGKN